MQNYIQLQILAAHMFLFLLIENHNQKFTGIYGESVLLCNNRAVACIVLLQCQTNSIAKETEQERDREGETTKTRSQTHTHTICRGNCISYTSCTQIKVIIRFYFIVCGGLSGHNLRHIGYVVWPVMKVMLLYLVHDKTSKKKEKERDEQTWKKARNEDGQIKIVRKKMRYECFRLHDLWAIHL